MVLAPEHPLAESLASPDQRAAVVAYQKSVASISELQRTKEASKTGVFTGTFLKHPISGELLPLWIADYVLASYGTGAVMAVPAHDDRDFEYVLFFN